MTMRVAVGSVRADPGTLSTVAVLDLRRRMYEFIRRADGPVTRDEAAAAVGISRKLAAFHLDKLVDAGLLEAGFARPPGLRRAGRTSKVYAPADIDVQVSIPPRDHAVLADILVCAVNQAFLAGFLRGLGASTATAALTRPPRACCVELLAAANGERYTAKAPERLAAG
jgi:predicted ArsR family transcriptional regulator